MKIKIPAKGLARALSVVTRALARSGAASSPALSGVLFEAAADGSLAVSATDAEIATTLACSTRVEAEGRALVPGRMLSQLVGSLGEGDLTLEAGGGGRIRLSTNDRSYVLRTYPAEDFPKLPEFPSEGVFEIPAEKFAGAVSGVLPCASKDASRPVLSGVLLAFSGGKATLAATDSYRMALSRDAFERRAGSVASDKGADGDAKAIIPARALQEAVRLGALGPGNIIVALIENLAFFKAAGVTLSARLIAGQYPDYEKLFPDAYAREFTVDREPLAKSLGRVNLFASRGTPPAPVKLSFSKGDGTLEGGTLEVACEGSELGSATERLGVEVSEAFTAQFNGEYLAAGLRAVGEAKVSFRFDDPLKPAVIVPAGHGGDANGASGLEYLIMPMRGPDGEADERDGKENGEG